MTYDPQAVTQYFDTFADQEWHRLDMNLQGRIKYAIHRKFIERHVAVGMQVLDVGSGPGRFAIDCAELGATVELVDISQVQLDLARSRIADRDLSKQITGFHCLDVLDMTSIAPNSFDVVGASAEPFPIPRSITWMRLDSLPWWRVQGVRFW